ncbi:hypothetical protein L7F22_024806 [Adiantum nelumboides]|nr:hypothetical protein [Adiantum nelumboides]
MVCDRLKLVLFIFHVVSPAIVKVVADISPSSTALLGYVQSHQDPRLKVNYHPPGSRIQKDPDQETLIMTDGERRKYECVLPREAEQQSYKDGASQQNSSSVTLMTDRRVTKAPDDLLALIKDLCVVRYEGWWMYEFCSHARLRQIHSENKKLVQEFDLGFYDAAATAKLHQNLSDVSLQKDHRSKPSAQRYYSHLFTNGTLCDLTNEPRETEVRFICSDTVNNMISSITEVSTCRYMLIFSTPILCKHP